jgi:hypothetical protein
MSLTVVFRETALRNLARIRGDDSGRPLDHQTSSLVGA